MTGEEDRGCRQAASELLDVALALCGLTEPARFRVGASDAQVLAHGRWLEYTIRRGDPTFLTDWVGSETRSCEHVPCVGELVGRWPRFLRTIEKALSLARRSPAVADVLVPGLRNLEQAAHWFPARGGPPTAELQRSLRAFLARFMPLPRFELLDVRNQYLFPDPVEGVPYTRRPAHGWLGIPSRVRRHRNKNAQRALNKDFPGDAAGHLFADRFGPSGGPENLAAQNPRSNSGGTYWDLEEEWAGWLERGCGVRANVEVVSREVKRRSLWWHVSWVRIDPDGTRTKGNRTFMNPHTPDSRDRQRDEIRDDADDANLPIPDARGVRR